MTEKQSENALRRSADLRGQVAVVTGSSSGMRAIALQLAEAGADVILHARSNQAGLQEVASAIRSMNRDCQTLRFDLANAAHHESLVDAAWDWRGAVDIWINNAGADVLTGDASHLGFEEKLELLWKVDVTATIRLSRLFGEYVQRQSGGQRGGVILNMGWDQSDYGMAGDSGEMFAATKGAVMSFSRSLARSLAPQIRVNCLAPGWIKTKWGEQASSSWQQRAKAESLMQRWGTPEDVARVARFLVSPAADFMTGQVIPINGGPAAGSS